MSENKPMEISAIETKTCSICLDAIGKIDVFVTKCNHMFCGTCILKHVRTSNLCPLCRSELMETEPTSDAAETAPAGQSNLMFEISDILANASHDSDPIATRTRSQTRPTPDTPEPTPTMVQSEALTTDMLFEAVNILTNNPEALTTFNGLVSQFSTAFINGGGGGASAISIDNVMDGVLELGSSLNF